MDQAGGDEMRIEDEIHIIVKFYVTTRRERRKNIFNEKTLANDF